MEACGDIEIRKGVLYLLYIKCGDCNSLMGEQWQQIISKFMCKAIVCLIAPIAVLYKSYPRLCWGVGTQRNRRHVLKHKFLFHLYKLNSIYTLESAVQNYLKYKLHAIQYINLFQ